MGISIFPLKSFRTTAAAWVLFASAVVGVPDVACRGAAAGRRPAVTACCAPQGRLVCRLLRLRCGGGPRRRSSAAPRRCRRRWPSGCLGGLSGCSAWRLFRCFASDSGFFLGVGKIVFLSIIQTKSTFMFIFAAN